MKNAGACLLFAAAVLVSFLAAPTSGWSQASSAAPGGGGQPLETTGSYLIGKGDILEINVWREPMLSGETIVRNDGMISLTLAGDVQAAGRTTSELKDEIQERLKRYLGDPVVTVILKSPASQKFYVIGEVKNPGEYELVKEMTVVQGIARAGGFSEWAKKKEIVLLRRENGAERRLPINYNDIVQGKSVSENMILRANDTIVVP